RLIGAYSYLRLDVQGPPGSTDTSAQSIVGSSPRHQAVLRSALDFHRTVSLDLRLQYQSRLPAQGVPAFLSLDARLAWQAGRPIELAVVGQNLLAAHHVEFGGNSASRTDVRRGVYAQVTLRR